MLPDVAPDCLSPDELERFAFGGLDDPLAVSLDRHVAQCAQCQARLDRLCDDPELSSWRNLIAPSGARAAGGDDANLDRLIKQFTPIEYFHRQCVAAQHDSSSAPAAEEVPESIGRYRIRGRRAKNGKKRFLGTSCKWPWSESRVNSNRRRGKRFN